MEKLPDQIRDVQGVKSVRNREDSLKIELFSRELPGGETWEIKGDLRKISQKLRNRLENARKNSEITSWNWIQKPEKQYTETGLKTGKVSDRKASGHKPPYYTVSIQK